MILLVKAKMSEIKLLIHDLVRVENLRVEAQEAMEAQEDREVRPECRHTDSESIFVVMAEAMGV